LSRDRDGAEGARATGWVETETVQRVHEWLVDSRRRWCRGCTSDWWTQDGDGA